MLQGDDGTDLSPRPDPTTSMRRRKRTQITVEHDTIYVVRTPPRVLRAWCTDCRAEVDMLTLEEAAVLVGCSMRQLVRSVEAGEVHFAETASGRLLICSHAVHGTSTHTTSSTNEPPGGTP